MQNYTLCGKNNLRSCIFILILGSIVYGNHLQNPFQFDTVVYIANNHTLDNVSKILNINFFKNNIFTNRGLLQISYALNAQLDGFRTFSYHLVNLILHLTNSLLIYFITRKIWCYFGWKGGWLKENDIHALSLFTAVLFLLHPIQTESVIYIMGRSEVFSGTFYLSAFMLFQVCIDKENPSTTRFKVLALLLVSVIFLLGFSVKQTLVTLPMILLLYFFFGRQPDSFSINILNKWKWGLGLIFIIGLFLLFRKLLTDESFLIGPSNAGENIGRLNYMLTQPSVLLSYYLKLFVFPINLNIDPDIRIVTQWWSWKFYAGIVAIVFAFFVSHRIKETRAPLFFVFWFLIVMSPSSSIITLNDLAAEHRTYLASYSFCAVSAVFIYRMPCLVFPKYPEKSRFVTLTISIFIVILFSIITIQRNQTWTSEVALWNDTLKKSPNKIRPIINLANAYTTFGSFDLAIEYYEKAMALNSKIFTTNYNLGNLYLERGREEEAINLLETAALIRPNNPEVNVLLGEVYLKRKTIDRAEFYFKKAVELNPNYALAMRNLGIIYYFHLKKIKEAVVYFSRSLSIDPNQKGADNIRILIKKIK
jgi:tetratricopeptide (TPR) repeat protein